MKASNLTAALLLACLAGVSANASAADVLKVGLPGDTTDVMPAVTNTRLVTFRYADDRSFLIRALTGSQVNIEVPQGESVVGFYLSDTEGWEFHVTGDDRRVLVKPLIEGRVNTGTLVTNERSYELTIASVPLGETWFQRVRWEIPSAHQVTGHYWRGAATGGAGHVTDEPQLAASSLNFGYRVKGRADFEPVAVFDDGTRTWLRFDGVQDLPAIFAKHGRQLEVVDFSVQGNYVVVPLVASEFVLRLRRQELTVERRG